MVCDTVVPAISRAEDPDGFWGRRASDVGTDQAILQALDAMPAEQAAGIGQLLDALALQGFNDVSQLSREQLFTNVSLASQDAAVGIGALVVVRSEPGSEDAWEGEPSGVVVAAGENELVGYPNHRAGGAGGWLVAFDEAAYVLDGRGPFSRATIPTGRLVPVPLPEVDDEPLLLP
jgi:hypothetical protein